MWGDPKTVFELYPDPKNNPLGPQKARNGLKIKLKSKVRIEEIIENKDCSTTLVDHKTVLKLYPDPKNSPLGKVSKIKKKLVEYSTKGLTPLPPLSGKKFY